MKKPQKIKTRTKMVQAIRKSDKFLTPQCMQIAIIDGENRKYNANLVRALGNGWEVVSTCADRYRKNGVLVQFIRYLLRKKIQPTIA